jgi:hypothetical protein
MTPTDPAQSTKYVFDFSEGDKDQKDRLGGKCGADRGRLPDYVSCSPFRIPAARLEAGRVALLDHLAEGGAGADSR